MFMTAKKAKEIAAANNKQAAADGSGDVYVAEVYPDGRARVKLITSDGGEFYL